MKQLLLGIILGMSIMASAAWAGHYFGHDPNAGAMEQFRQNWERLQQEQFRQQEQGRRFLNPC